MSTRAALLFAKGAFGQSTGEYVRVNVKDALPSVRTGVKNESKLAVRVFARKVLSNRHHFCEKRRVACGKLNNIRIGLGFGDDQKVNRSTWRDVTKRDDRVRLEDDVGGNLSGDDAGKYTH